MKKFILSTLLLFLTINFYSLEVEVICDSHSHEYVDKLYFDLCYDYNYNIAHWTRYEMTPDKIDNLVDRPSNYFRKDRDLPRVTAEHKDYTRSGYDRGHLVPADDMMYSEESVKSTFVISNVVPQLGKFNGGIWKKMENYASDFVELNGESIIITGPIVDKSFKVIGKSTQIAVPSHFWKLLVSEKEIEAFIIPHENFTDEIMDYKVSLEELKSRTGLDFKIVY